MNHIDKEIFKQTDVSKRLRKLSIWYWILAAMGVLCTFLYVTISGMSSGLSALLLLGLVVGDFCALIVLCYYLFGDKYGAYYKPKNQYMVRECDYYPHSLRQQLLSSMETKDAAALANIKKGTAPDLISIRYTDDGGHVLYGQLLELENDKETPITEVVSFV